MNPFSCSREFETVRAAWSGAWPAGCDEDLQQHVRSCTVCREAVQLAAAFREDREAATHEARIPPAGLVWWRAQLRARREAAVVAERPVAVAQGLAVVAALAAAAGVVWALLPSVRTFFGGVASSLPAPSDVLPSLPSATGVFSNPSAWSLLAQPGILIVLAATLVLAPVAIYLAVAKD
jgi:hypothetical protein